MLFGLGLFCGIIVATLVFWREQCTVAEVKRILSEVVVFVDSPRPDNAKAAEYSTPLKVAEMEEKATKRTRKWGEDW